MENQFSIQESCLKSKQKKDKYSYTDFDHNKVHKSNQTEDLLDLICGRSFDFEEYCLKFPHTSAFLEDSKIQKNVINLVPYDVDSNDSDDQTENVGSVTLQSATHCPNDSVILKNVNNFDHIKRYQPKICEINSSKRKSKVPKKVDTHLRDDGDPNEDECKWNRNKSNIAEDDNSYRSNAGTDVAHQVRTSRIFPAHGGILFISSVTIN